MLNKLFNVTGMAGLTPMGAALFVIKKGFGKLPKKVRIGFWVAMGLLVLWITKTLTVAVMSMMWSFSSGEVTFTAEGKDRVVRGGESFYEVYTSEGVFINQDALTRMKRDSADLQNDIRTGKTYKCETQGFRNKYFSMMENLISCEEVIPANAESTNTDLATN